jgi:L-lactate dehydrogenase complex protein LldF
MGRQALRCIRCSACLNVCPVYERVGGHSYGSVYPGPIGAVLNPLVRGTSTPVDKSLPYASSLCGACFDACPVRIQIPDLLVRLRTRVIDEKRGGVPSGEELAMRGAAWMFSDAARWEKAQKGSELGGRLLRRRETLGRLPGPLAAWTDARDAPTPPEETFRTWWKRERS